MVGKEETRAASVPANGPPNYVVTTHIGHIVPRYLVFCLCTTYLSRRPPKSSILFCVTSPAVSCLAKQAYEASEALSAVLGALQVPNSFFTLNTADSFQ